MVAYSGPTYTTATVAEYLALEETEGVKHEYVDGHVYAMSGGTLAHDLIANDVRATIGSHVAGGPCTLFGPDVRLRVSPTVYYPDALVVCADSLDLGAVEVTAPRLIVEVLSASTEATDRGDKWINYQTLATCEEYLLVDSRRRSVERFRRGEHGLWIYQRYAPGTGVTLESIGLTCPLDAIYRRTSLSS